MTFLVSFDFTQKRPTYHLAVQAGTALEAISKGFSTLPPGMRPLACVKAVATL